MSNAAVNILSLEEQIIEIAANAKKVASIIANADEEQKNNALKQAANSIRKNAAIIINANEQDVQIAKENGISGSFLDRLILNDDRLESMAKALEDIVKLPDPVGRELAKFKRPNGLNIKRVSVPIGVIGIIYESRPNVTADAGALALKSGNCAILRGGSESALSSKAILQCLQDGLEKAGLPKEAIQALPSQAREGVGIMLRQNQYIDLIVPRGGKGLIKRIMEDSSIPTIQHLDGNCHTYIHTDADINKALEIVKNAKTRRTGVCGATESIVIDKAIAPRIIPDLCEALEDVEIRGEDQAIRIDNRIQKANADDWGTEYLDSIVSLKIVDDIDEGIAWVQKYSSAHTDCIVTENTEAAENFLNQIDSAIVMLNASTQFADGGEFGMGAEIGISTGKLHARGPVGLEQLNTFKYKVYGNGQTRP